MPRWIASFHPQAWINDYAVDVDPEGTTEWDVTDVIETDFKGVPPEADDYPSDTLRYHPNAPEWVREWSDPFYVSVRND